MARRGVDFSRVVTPGKFKEVIQPHVPVRLPCYDFTPITNHNLGPETGTSVAIGFRGVTGGVYKARERIHRSLLICDY